METDEVDFTTKTAELSGEFLDMVGSVVETFEYDIFEEHAALSAPVVLTDSVDDFANWISFFHWHDFHSFVVERRVEADSEVAFRLVEETFHIRYHAHCRHCDASRTHGEAPVGCHHVERAHECLVDSLPVSSSRIRKLLAATCIDQVNRLLGYKYSISGVVEHGNGIGAQIGFPTANMQLYEPLKLIPGNGVYFVKVEALDRMLYGMCNIGYRPTVGQGNARTIETHILDFDEDIYGLDLKLTFIARIREERRFESLEALKAQLVKDKEACMTLSSRA